MVNWFEIGVIFLLGDQINNSYGPKMVRGPDFGKHCLNLTLPYSKDLSNEGSLVSKRKPTLT
jgi:hypothetical protein